MTSLPSFVHLRVHSTYSLSEGAIKLPELVRLCRDAAMPAVAVTDTNNLFAAMEFGMAAKKAGIQPIIGCQVDVVREDEQGRGTPNPFERRRDRLVLLVQDEAGWRNLSRIVSDGWLADAPDAPHVTLERIGASSDGLICLGGGPDGPLGRLVEERRPEAADALCRRLSRMFPGRFYVELQRHGRDLEERIEDALVDLAHARDVPLVATNDVYFAAPADYEAHDALLCIADGVQVAERSRRRLTERHCFRSGDEMRELFSDLPEAVANSVAVARRCGYRPPERAPILPPFPASGRAGEEEMLRAMAADGLAARLAARAADGGADGAARRGAEEPYRERLAFELDVIAGMGFPGYFLIVADIIQWAKKQGIPVGPGRGSGAGSVVAWALTITDLDPLRFDLLFERFLNPERVSMPDFDIDFCQDRRDEVIRYIQDKYGADRVAQIITFGTFQARGVLRDVGRVLGLPHGRIDKIAKLVRFDPAKPPKLREAIDEEPELRRLRDEDETGRQLVDIALRLEGLHRHASTHAAGVIIGDRPLADLVPLYRDDSRSDRPATQFSMKYADAAGLVKFDLLGLKTLTVLDLAVKLVRGRGGDMDLQDLPLDDEETYRMLGRGETVGVFQMESGGMRDTLRKLLPDAFEDLVALVSLYRPGPMDNIPRYIACKHGRERPEYLHPLLEPVLKETFGVMIYQEQVMKVAQVLSGYSLGQADLLRRAMGKKDEAEMNAQREAFVRGAVDNGVDRRRAAGIFDQVRKFAQYGFNKSHAAAYALVAYQTAYLKTHHPVEFVAASMTLDFDNTDKLNVFRQELGRLGIPLLPPDANRSRADFSVERDGEGRLAVRYALGAIRNVSRASMSDLVREREAGGPFRGVADFAKRLGGRLPGKRQIESLARAGAFDCLEPNRRRLHEGADAVAALAGSADRDRNSGQASLLAGIEAEADEGARLRLPDVADWPAMERLSQEFGAVGSYLSAHPLDACAGELKALGVVEAADVDPGRSGEPARLAGVVIGGRQERTSARGGRFAFVRLSDRSGVFEIVVFSELLAAARELLEPGRRLLVTVDVRADDGGDGARLSASAVEPLDDALAATPGDLRIAVAAPEGMDPLGRVLGAAAAGRRGVVLVLDLGEERRVEMRLPGRIASGPDVLENLRGLPGVALLEA